MMLYLVIVGYWDHGNLISNASALSESVSGECCALGIIRIVSMVVLIETVAVSHRDCA